MFHKLGKLVSTHKTFLSLYAVSLLPGVFMAYLIGRYAVNVPYMDDWSMVLHFRDINEGNFGWNNLWSQHNEHRILFPRLVIIGLAYLTDWHLGAQIIVSFYLCTITALILVLTISDAIKDRVARVLASVLVGTLLFSPIQWENWLWGWQIEWFMSITATVVAFYTLTRLDLKTGLKSARLYAALFLGTVATLSLGSGLLVWPIGLAVLAALRLRKQIDKSIQWFWGGYGLAITVIYFIGYSKPKSHPSLTAFIEKPVDFIGYFLVVVGRPVAGSQETATLMGAVLVLLLVPILFMVWIERQNIERYIVWLAIAFMALGAVMITSLSRFGLGMGSSMAGRYTAYSLLYMLALCLIVLAFLGRLSLKSTHAVSPEIRSVLFVVPVIPLIVASYIHGFAGFKEHSTYLLLIKHCTSEAKPSDECLRLTYPDPKIVRQRLDYLKVTDWADY